MLVITLLQWVLQVRLGLLVIMLVETEGIRQLQVLHHFPRLRLLAVGVVESVSQRPMVTEEPAVLEAVRLVVAAQAAQPQQLLADKVLLVVIR